MLDDDNDDDDGDDVCTMQPTPSALRCSVLDARAGRFVSSRPPVAEREGGLGSEGNAHVCKAAWARRNLPGGPLDSGSQAARIQAPPTSP